MKRLVIVMIVLGAVMGGLGASRVDALTEVTPIVGTSSVGFFPHVDVWELKCPSATVSLEVVVTDSDEDGDYFNVMLTGLSPATVYATTVSAAASYSNQAMVRLSRSTPGAIKALLYVSGVQGSSSLYDYEFKCLGVGGVYKTGVILQQQNQ